MAAGSLATAAVRAAPVAIGGALALPEIAGVMLVGAICLGGLMVFRHLTDSEANVSFNKKDGFSLSLKRAS
jgi:hypothetical protein